MPSLVFCFVICLALAACSLSQPADAPATQPSEIIPSAAMATPTASTAPVQIIVSTKAADARANAGSLSASATLRPPLRAYFATASAEPQAYQNEAQAEHIVVWGDTLSGIASKYGASLSTLMRLNDLSDPDRLEAGQALKLPAAPESTTPSLILLPDRLLARSAGAFAFDVAEFIRSQPGALKDLRSVIVSRGASGEIIETSWSASDIIDRVSQEYSVDPRVLLALLEVRAQLLSERSVDEETILYPLISADNSGGMNRAGLYAQLSWLADRLNYGYYSFKFRGRGRLDLGDGSSLRFHPQINAGTASLQYVLSLFRDVEDWQADISESGFIAVYSGLFGDPHARDDTTLAAPDTQPRLDLPFRAGEVWRFTGGFHGGWGNGSGWSAIDFAPPFEEDKPYACFTSSHPLTAVARGLIVRLAEGVVVLDLDLDGDEGSGWTILYLHITKAESLREGQIVERGAVLGYPSCLGGYSTATHLHIARRYQGEWLPADCPACAADRRPPPFVMNDWRVVGLPDQLYQGFLLNQRDNRSVIAEQGRHTDINEIWR